MLVVGPSKESQGKPFCNCKNKTNASFAWFKLIFDKPKNGKPNLSKKKKRKGMKETEKQLISNGLPSNQLTRLTKFSAQSLHFYKWLQLQAAIPAKITSIAAYLKPFHHSLKNIKEQKVTSQR